MKIDKIFPSAAPGHRQVQDDSLTLIGWGFSLQTLRRAASGQGAAGGGGATDVWGGGCDGD
ncbi:MAG: hypothetical protein OIN85_04690 [Candidatus Methanoperedens sp.]|nr:hypothetical protein [Candidatus Methanoperedens sp.]